MKTPNELNALRKEFEELKKKLAELTDEELEQVTGGDDSQDSGYNPNEPGPEDQDEWVYKNYRKCQWCGRMIVGTKQEIDEHISNCKGLRPLEI